MLSNVPISVQISLSYEFFFKVCLSQGPHVHILHLVDVSFLSLSLSVSLPLSLSLLEN